MTEQKKSTASDTVSHHGTEETSKKMDSSTVVFTPIRDEDGTERIILEGGVKGGVPIPDRKPEKIDNTPAGTPIRRRRKPSMAGAGQKLTVLIMALVLAFSLGILAGIGLAYGVWSTGSENLELQLQNQTLPAENRIPPEITETAEPSEGLSETEAPTEAVTQPMTEPLATEEPSTASEPTPAQPEPQKPEPQKPEPQKPEPQKPEPQKPESQKPESQKPEPKPTPKPEPQKPTVTGYILPDSSSRKLTYEDYKDLSHWQLILARNEIYARHGRRFENAEIQEYFDSCSWYKGTADHEDFDYSVITGTELYNVYLLKDAAEGGSPQKTGYIFSDSSTRKLTDADCQGLSHWQLILARNEIYARHGRKFQNQDIQNYFNSCSWYQGTIAPEDFDYSVITEIERYNVYLLKDAAEAR